MGFWIFMLIIDLLIPVVMVVFGIYFEKRALKNINPIFGYRTSMSMKNKDTWEFAHHHCGKLWHNIGWIMLVASVIAMLYPLGKDIDFIGAFGGVICGIQIVILTVSLFPTEIALRKTYDKNGCRRS